MEKAKVYFTRKLEPKSLIEIYDKLNIELPGKVAVKLHSGEEGNQNYLKPEFVKDIIEYLNATVVECNTAYEGKRNTTEKHKELLKKHGWSNYFDVDILDDESDEEIEIKNGKNITKNYVGSKMKNYDSMLILSHFKGHPMGGYGGAIKNTSIGLASSKGKGYIHTNGNENAKYEDLFTADHDKFLESMADAAKSIIDIYKNKLVFINVMVNMSVDCDCCSDAKPPCMNDIGILASLDPVALDQACIDLVYQSSDKGKEQLIERIESRNGLHTIEAAKNLNIGTTEYELIEF